jgi:peptidoglycan hydrolase-like protein with peptidoglycan-binding domain
VHIGTDAVKPWYKPGAQLDYSYQYVNDTDKKIGVSIVRQLVNSTGKVVKTGGGTATLKPHETFQRTIHDIVAKTTPAGEYTVTIKVLTGKKILAENSFNVQVGQPVATAVPAIPKAAATSVSVNNVFVKQLVLGSKNEEVKMLQQLLQSLGFFPLDISPNGNFGPVTAKAVKKFQSAHRISPVGFVGPATRAVLNSARSDASTPAPSEPASPPTPPAWSGINESGNVKKSQDVSYQTPELSAGSYLFTMTGTGDSDLYVSKGRAPSISSHDCKSDSSGPNEQCTIDISVPTVLHTMVRGYAVSSDYQLVGKIK